MTDCFSALRQDYIRRLANRLAAGEDISSAGREEQAEAREMVRADAFEIPDEIWAHEPQHKLIRKRQTR
jgi:hypothetical protein